MTVEEKIPAVLSWSGGKDSAFALYRILKSGIFDVRALLTTFNGSNKRVSMHGIHEFLIIQQSSSLGIPLVKSYLQDPTNIAYEKTMKDQFKKLYQEGIRKILFGDIFLEDLRHYREQLTSGTGITCEFPLWGENTSQLMQEFLDLNFKTIVCSLDAGKLPKQLAGQVLTNEWIQSLPEEVDPCGENGEFHTFCFDGPVFRQPIVYKLGNTQSKSYPAPGKSGKKKENKNTLKFWFCDIQPN